MNCTYRICKLEKKKTVLRIISLHVSLVAKFLLLQSFYSPSFSTQSPSSHNLIQQCMCLNPVQQLTTVSFVVCWRFFCCFVVCLGVFCCWVFGVYFLKKWIRNSPIRKQMWYSKWNCVHYVISKWKVLSRIWAC